MNQNIAGIIAAVADNNIQHAKQFARALINNDNTQINKSFCNRIRNKLDASSLNLIELPHDVRDILRMEDVAASFNENRYFLSGRESKVVSEILGMYETSKTLTEMGIQYLNSIMLYGESGTGKTSLGKYIAYKLHMPFVYINFSNAINSYLGGTSKNIAKAFDFVEKQKCVFMLDEVDAIGMKRGKEDVGEMSRITIALMQALDCVKNDTIIIGATNRIDMIDKALLRRFTLQHEVKKLNSVEIEKMIIKFLEDVGISYNYNNLQEYCQKGNSQAYVINDVIRAIALSVRTGNDFLL